MTCSLEKLSGNVTKNCDPIAPGIGDLIYFINYDDVDKSLCTFNSSNPLIIETLVLKTTSPQVVAFTLQGQRASNAKGCAYAPTDFAPAWTHGMTFRIFDNDPIAKKRVTEFANSKLMCIYANNYINRTKASTPQDSTYELIGWDAGLYLSECNDTDEATNGGWMLKVATPSKGKESNVPLQYFNTSIAATEAALASLL